MTAQPEKAVNRGVVLAATTMAAFLTPFIASAVNVALPVIGREFNIDAVSLGWVATSYIMAAVVFLLPFGRAADIFGRRRVFFYGTIVFTLASLLSAMAGSASQLIACRVLQGIGGAGVFGTATAILTSAFPAQERGRVLGINVTAVYIGLALGPFLGGLLTQTWGWRSIFLATVPLGLAIIAFVLWRMRSDWAPARGERFDLTGAAVYGLSIVALVYGLSLLPQASAILFLLAGSAGIIVFGWWQTRTPSPLLNIGLFRHNRIFILSNLAALINYSATFAVSFLLSLYLQYIKGLSPQDAGLVLVAMPIVMAALSPQAGRLSDRIEPRIVASLGMGLTVLGLLPLIFIGQGTPIALLVTCLVVMGAGFAFFSSPNTNAVMSCVDKSCYGVASSTLGTMRLAGQMVSLGIALMLFAIYIGHVQITPASYGEFLSSLRPAFVIFTALCGLGILASLGRGRTR